MSFKGFISYIPVWREAEHRGTSLSSTSPPVEQNQKSGQHSTEGIVTRSLHLNDAHVAEASACEVELDASGRGREETLHIGR